MKSAYTGHIRVSFFTSIPGIPIQVKVQRGPFLRCNKNIMQFETLLSIFNNKHKVICEQRLYINLCTQMKTIATITGLPMHAHWPGSVFVYVWGLKCVRARVNMRCVCVCVWCVCVVCVCVWCVVYM